MASVKRWLSGILVLVVVVAVSPAARAETTGGSPLADDPTLIALAVALSCSDAPEVVEAAPQGPSAPAATGPEIELVATVRAKTLRFEEVPKVDVVFRGTGKRKTVWRTERVNLPMHPQPGVVYHDVQVRLTISSDLDELTSMLREARRASRGIRIEDALAAAPVAAPKVADPPRKAAPKAAATPRTESTPTATPIPTPAAAPIAAPSPAPAPAATPTPTALPAPPKPAAAAPAAPPGKPAAPTVTGALTGPVTPASTANAAPAAPAAH
jgi:hypothetical protein